MSLDAQIQIRMCSQTQLVYCSHLLIRQAHSIALVGQHWFQLLLSRERKDESQLLGYRVLTSCDIKETTELEKKRRASNHLALKSVLDILEV